MQKSNAPNTSFDADAPAAADADAVQKTGYVVGKGTDDRARRAPEAADPHADRDDTDRDPPARRGTSGV